MAGKTALVPLLLLLITFQFS